MFVQSLETAGSRLPILFRDEMVTRMMMPLEERNVLMQVMCKCDDDAAQSQICLRFVSLTRKFQ
jgi:hypothetical protein